MSQTHRRKFLRKHNLSADTSLSLDEIAELSGHSKSTLQEVYNRGIGAYKTNPESVRMKGTFKKGVRAPLSKKLSKEQWAMSRVYSFVDGNPKHDADLRGGIRGRRDQERQNARLNQLEQLQTRRNELRQYYDDRVAQMAQEHAAEQAEIEGAQQYFDMLLEYNERAGMDDDLTDERENMAMADVVAATQRHGYRTQERLREIDWLNYHRHHLERWFDEEEQRLYDQIEYLQNVVDYSSCKPWDKKDDKGGPDPPEACAPHANWAWNQYEFGPDERAYAAAGAGLHGQGLWDSFKRGYEKVKNEFLNPESYLRTGQIFRGAVREGYSPSARATIERYKDYSVISLTIRRDPIQSLIHTAFNFITMGQWDKARAKYHFDKLFHLGLVVGLKGPRGDVASVLVEKNEVINVGPWKREDSDTQLLPIQPPMPPRTFLEFLHNAENSMPNYFLYDPFKNNCQDFIRGVLRANGVLSPAADAFVKQNVDELLGALPSYTAPVARAITDVGAVVNRALEGGGKAPHSKFATQLKEAGISPDEYLKAAQKAAAEHDYPANMLGFADDGVHKLAIPDDEGRIVKFGRVGYGDFILYQVLEKAQKVPRGTADSKQRRFHNSHKALPGDWEKNPFSPNNLALKILW